MKSRIDDQALLTALGALEFWKNRSNNLALRLKSSGRLFGNFD